MDGSFLSLTSIVQASRRFVCIRTLTYEDAEERDFQRSLFIGRSGDVENTTFCMIAPDGKNPLTQPARGIRQVFQSPEHMASWMGEAADYYEAERAKASLKPAPITALPLVGTVRLGLNTAAADNLPLVVLYSPSPADRSRLEAAAASLAWKPEFAGRCVYASTVSPGDLSPVDAGAVKPGFLVIQPEGFGLAGKVLARAEATAGPEQLAGTLRQGLQAFRPRALTGFEYVRAAHAAGAFWETKLPVTDIQEAHARERARRSFIPPQRRESE